MFEDQILLHQRNYFHLQSLNIELNCRGEPGQWSNLFDGAGNQKKIKFKTKNRKN